MEVSDLRGLATVFCMASFIAVVVWAYTPSRKKDFEEAAKLPFGEGGER